VRCITALRKCCRDHHPDRLGYLTLPLYIAVDDC
jgi:hypothetical protein